MSVCQALNMMFIYSYNEMSPLFGFVYPNFAGHHR